MDLDDYAKVATIFGALPGGITAIIFSLRAAHTHFIAPGGLRVEVRRERDGTSYVINVANLGLLDHHINAVGVMLAHTRPLWPPWVRTYRQIKAKRSSDKSLEALTLVRYVDCLIERGKSQELSIPYFDTDMNSDSRQPSVYKRQTERYEEWQNRSGGPGSLVPFVRKSTGDIVLGKKVDLRKRVSCLATMSCRCGHSPTVHRRHLRKRLSAEAELCAPCESCRCRRYVEVGEPGC